MTAGERTRLRQERRPCAFLDRRRGCTGIQPGGSRALQVLLTRRRIGARDTDGGLLRERAHVGVGKDGEGLVSPRVWVGYHG